MNRLRPLEHWDHGFESHSRYGWLCVHLFCVCVFLCVCSDLATGRSPVQGVLPTVYRIKKLKKRARSKGRYSQRDRENINNEPIPECEYEHKDLQSVHNEIFKHNNVLPEYSYARKVATVIFHSEFLLFFHSQLFHLFLHALYE
jgi:hypothetical protein